MSDHPSILNRLLCDARGGNDVARDELFHRCRNYLHLLATNQLESWFRNKIDASDLVQQTMLDAHRAFRQFQGQSEGEWLAWIKQILSHNVQDLIRSYRTEKRAANREVSLNRPAHEDESNNGWDPAGGDPTPSQLLMEQERRVDLANAIATLPEDYQEVLRLRSIQRLPFDEVAERMERSRGAVQMLWMRAVQQLQKQLVENVSS